MAGVDGGCRKRRNGAVTFPGLLRVHGLRVVSTDTSETSQRGAASRETGRRCSVSSRVVVADAGSSGAMSFSFLR